MARHKRIAKGVRLAIAAAGGKKILAAKLGIREQSLNNWKRVPRERIMQVEEITGVSRELLAPDLFKRAVERKPFGWRSRTER